MESRPFYTDLTPTVITKAKIDGKTPAGKDAYVIFDVLSNYVTIKRAAPMVCFWKCRPFLANAKKRNGNDNNTMTANSCRTFSQKPYHTATNHTVLLSSLARTRQC